MIKVLYSDDDVRLIEENDVFVLEYLDACGKPEHRQTFNCKLCALRMCWSAVAVFSGGPCRCMIPMRIEAEGVVAQAGGGLN